MDAEKAKDNDAAKPWEVEDGGLVGTELGSDRSKTGSANLRFWLPKGEERRIIFLTEGDKAKKIWEHQVRLNGDWRNWFTSLSWCGINPDPLMDFSQESNMFKRYNALVFSIIDTHEFTDRNGNKRKNLKKLFLAKRDTAEILKRIYLKRLENDEGLRGAMFDVYRTNSDKSASVGEQFEFVKMVDLDSFEDTEEFDIGEVFEPQPKEVADAVEQLRRENGMAGAAPEGAKAKVDY
tara:strand:+ start:810 stop:1517 length:708 start_codon:yes stop_codon:yes gene_type:complete